MMMSTLNGRLGMAGKEVEVVWACDAKIGALCRKDDNGSTREWQS